MREFASRQRIPRYLGFRTFRFGDFVSADFSADAETRYQDAVARREAIRDTWQAEGSPLLASGSTGQLVEHPLVKMLRGRDLLVDRLSAAARKRHRGPDRSAVLKASIGKSPAAKLRAM